MADKLDKSRPPPRGGPVYPVPYDHTEDEGDLGSVQIHNGVMAVIARLATMKVQGVVDMSGTLVDGLAGMVKKSPDSGVHVEIVDGDNVLLTLNVVMGYGVSIPKVAGQIQHDVREAIEQMTGKTVKAVNVVVKSIQVPRGTEADRAKKKRDEE